MNKGLKSYTKQLTKKLGSSSFHINLNKDDSNLIMEIPILKTNKLRPINLSLIYNHLDRNEDIGFGKGVKLNLYSEILEGTNEISVKNSDGSIDSYQLIDDEVDKFKCDETGTIIEKRDSKVSSMDYYYHIEDKYGNSKQFADYDLIYPKLIDTKNNERYELSFNSSTFKTISNKVGDTIEIRLYDGYIDFTYYQEYSGTKTKVCNTIVYFDTNNNINFVDYNVDDFIKESLELSFDDNTINILNYETNNSLIFNFENERVVSLSEVFKSTKTRTTLISYENYKTIVTNHKNECTTFYFDENKMPLLELDNYDTIIGTKYENDTKLIKEVFGPVYLRDTKNNLLNNIDISDFNNTGLTITKVNCTDDRLSGLIGNSLYRVEGTGKLSYDIIKSGLGTDNIIFGMWTKMLTVYSTNTNINICLISNGCKSYEMKNTRLTNSYEFTSISKKCMDSYDKITIEIELKGNASIEIGGLVLFKKLFGAFYKYDEYKNLLNVDFGLGSTSYCYDKNNKNVKSLSVDSTNCSKVYNTDNLIKEEYTHYGVKTESTYDANKQLINKKFNSVISDKEYNIKNEYELGDTHTETTYNDLQVPIITSNYDYLGRILNAIDCINTNTEYSYNNYGLLVELAVLNGNISSNIIYHYDQYQRIDKLTLSNGTIYDFAYNEYDKLTKVKINDRDLITLTYDDNCNLLTKKYSSKDSYLFEYNENDLVENVYYIDYDGTQSLRYNYVYDNLNRVKNIKDGSDKILFSYEYDVDGNLIKIIDSDLEIFYGYDNLQNVNIERIKSNNIDLYQSYDTISRSKGSNPEALENYIKNCTYYLTCSFLNDYNITNKYIGLTPVSLEETEELVFEKEYDGIIPCLTLDNTKKLRYYLNIDMMRPNESGAIAFWFKPNSINNKAYLFSARSIIDQSFLGVFISNGQLYLESIDYQGNYKLLASTTKGIRSGKWNFFALNFMNREVEQNDPKVCEYELTLNSESVSYTQQDPRLPLSVGTSPIFNIGFKWDSADTYSYYYNGKISCLLIGKNGYVPGPNLKEYYRVTKDYLIDNQYNDQEVKAVDFSVARSINLCNTYINNLDIVPLHNNVISINETKPHKFSVRTVTDLDKDRTFNFNKEIKDYAYVADGGELKYKYTFNNCGTIIMKVYIDSYSDKQYLFEALDNDGNKFGLFRNSNNVLCLDLNGTTIYSSLTLTNDLWHMVSVSFSQNLTEDSLGCTTKNIAIVLDNQEHVFVLEDETNYTELLISVGATNEYIEKQSNLEYTYNNYPLLGLIEYFAVDKTTNYSNEILFEMSNYIVKYAKTTMYDEFGFIQKQEVNKYGNSILSTLYEYKKTSDNKYVSQNISKETIKGNGSIITTRNYESDNFGRIKKITDDIFGSHEYCYDYRGFLERDNNTTYTYDKNGNILTNGTNTYLYDLFIKDRIVKYNDINITYDYRNPFFMKTFGTKAFEYEGNKLVSFIDNSVNLNVSFEYGVDGLRTYKRVNNNGNNYYHHYIYSGNKLISEMTNSYQLDYLYDEKGQLYGFIENNVNTYFYVRDVLNNIIGITLQNGELVVKYTYDAYGKVLSITGTKADTIGDINPFRYKGYYYDVETGLAMVGQRYYSPELCRFIQPADVSSLNPQSINGLNLYSYANNNPIGIAYSSSSVGFGASGGMIGSTIGTISNIVGSGSVGGGSKVSGFGSLGGLSFGGINWPKANSVAMTHYTTSLIENAFIGSFFGNISYTVTTQLNDSKMFYSYSNIGNGGYSAGVGMNLGNWYGISAYVSSNLGFGTSMQLTPWITYGAEISLQDGISFSFGTISGNTTQEITANVGWGTIAGAYLVCAGIAAIPMPGARALAGAAACVILLIDIFN